MVVGALPDMLEITYHNEEAVRSILHKLTVAITGKEQIIGVQ
jgi:hypothetical protein